VHDFQTRRQKSLCESFANRNNDFSARGHRVVALKKKSKALARSRTKKNHGEGGGGGRAPALSARSSRVGCPFNTTCGGRKRGVLLFPPRQHFLSFV